MDVANVWSLPSQQSESIFGKLQHQCVVIHIALEVLHFMVTVFFLLTQLETWKV